jgi:hypothetical protein
MCGPYQTIFMPSSCGPRPYALARPQVPAQPDLNAGWIVAASGPRRDGALQPGSGGPLPWHLHVFSTGSTAGLHTGLVGCGDIDDGSGMGQAGADDQAAAQALARLSAGENEIRGAVTALLAESGPEHPA